MVLLICKELHQSPVDVESWPAHWVYSALNFLEDYKALEIKASQEAGGDQTTSSPPKSEEQRKRDIWNM